MQSLVSGRVDQDLRSATELEGRADECVITHLANPTINPKKKRTVQKGMSCRVERHRWHQDQVYKDLQMKGVHNKSCFRHHLPSKPDLE